MELAAYKVDSPEAKFFKFIIRQINYDKTKAHIDPAIRGRIEIIIEAYFRKSLKQIAKDYIRKYNDLSINDCLLIYQKWLSKSILRTDFNSRDNFYLYIHSSYNSSYYDLIPYRVIKKLNIPKDNYPEHLQYKYNDLNNREATFFRFVVEEFSKSKSYKTEDDVIIIECNKLTIRGYVSEFQWMLRYDKLVRCEYKYSNNDLRRYFHRWYKKDMIDIDHGYVTFNLSYNINKHMPYIRTLPESVKFFLKIYYK